MSRIEVLITIFSTTRPLSLSSLLWILTCKGTDEIWSNFFIHDRFLKNQFSILLHLLSKKDNSTTDCIIFVKHERVYITTWGSWIQFFIRNSLYPYNELHSYFYIIYIAHLAREEQIIKHSMSSQVFIFMHKITMKHIPGTNNVLKVLVSRP